MGLVGLHFNVVVMIPAISVQFAPEKMSTYLLTPRNLLPSLSPRTQTHTPPLCSSLYCMVSDEHTITRWAVRCAFFARTPRRTSTVRVIVKLDRARDAPTSSFFYTFCGAPPQIHRCLGR